MEWFQCWQLTSAKLWASVKLTPGERSRRLCRSSSHRRPLFWQQKTGGLNPDTEKRPMLFYSPRTSPPPSPAKTAYFVFGTRCFRREQRRNVFSAWNEEADVHLPEKQNIFTGEHRTEPQFLRGGGRTFDVPSYFPKQRIKT